MGQSEGKFRVFSSFFSPLRLIYWSKGDFLGRFGTFDKIFSKKFAFLFSHINFALENDKTLFSFFSFLKTKWKILAFEQ